MCWNGTRVAAEQQRAADAGGEGDHPGGDAGRDDDQAERADAEAGHERGGDHLAAGIERREQVEREAEPDARRGPTTSPTISHCGTWRPERPT